jgi:prolyl oligopeptidase
MKMDLDRRSFLAGTTGALSLSLLPLKLLATATASKSTIPPAPVARIDVVKDTYFGETVSDPYRWMENSKDPEWLPFLKGQNDHTRAIIDALPGRAALLKRIQQLSGEAVATTRVQRAGGLTFIQQRRQLQALCARRAQRPGSRVGRSHRGEQRQEPRVARLVARLA